jgi:pilus assembly protein CpaC
MTMRVDMPFSDILIGQAEIAEVLPLSDRTLYILGKKIGTTNVSILDSDRRLVGVIDVEVGIDTDTVGQRIIDGTGQGGVQARSVGDKVVLSGVAPDGATLDRAVGIAAGMAPGGVINATRVASPQQVMLQVRFLEVNRVAGRDLGVLLSRSRGGLRAATGGFPAVLPDRGVGGDGSGNITLNTTTSAALGNLGVPFAAIALLGSDLDLHITALEQKNMLRRLAEPNLIAVSGESAQFHAGGEFPIPVASDDQGGFRRITVEWKEFGVKLSFTPTVLRNGLINLKMKPEVSELNFAGGIAINNLVLPGITVRRANTTVELKEGQSFAIAGLLQNKNERRIEGVPWLMDVPVLGQLFRSNGYQTDETELVVIVTPHFVRPARPGDALHTPVDKTIPANDADFFLAAKNEVERGRPGPVGHLVKTQGAALGAHGHIVTAPARPIARKKTVTTQPQEPLTVKN